MKDFLAKTNSWHWLVAALVVCGTVSAFLWNRQIEAVRAERDPALARMAAHLEALRALLPEGPETLDAQTASLKTRLEALRQEVVDAGFAPIPEGADAVLATKNAVEQAMAARSLRVLSSAFAAAPEPTARGKTSPSAAKAAAQPVSADAYAREVQRAAAKMPANMRDDFLRDAQRKIAQLKAAARSSVGIRLGGDAASFQIRTMVTQIEFLNATIAKVEREVASLLAKVEPSVTTIPGVSTTTGAQIVAEIGDVKRFKNAASIVKYAGLNSGVDESGKLSAEGVPITKHGSPYLRRSLWLAANRARQHDPRLKAFYDKKRREGKPHRVAVTAVARKLCHVVFAVMRDGEPYDPAK